MGLSRASLNKIADLDILFGEITVGRLRHSLCRDILSPGIDLSADFATTELQIVRYHLAMDK
jgi:hypothetical protein